jgi:mRNA interferase RelE/StbE
LALSYCSNAREVLLRFLSAGLTRENDANQLVAAKAEADVIGDRAPFDDMGRSGYSLARMAFAIILAPEAVEDLRRIKAHVRAAVRAALETHLRHEPDRTSRSRIKRLRGLRRPQYRLRVGEVRVFYDVTGTTVEVLAIVAKSEVQSWLAQFASPE